MKADFSLSHPSYSRNVFHSPFLSVLLFATLFFLSSADMFFTAHILSYNVRWGQLLLLLMAWPALKQLWIDNQRGSQEGKRRFWFLLYWLPFFLVYGFAALYSATPLLTGIKWGWGLFNIGLAALVCLNPRQDDSLERGFQGAVILIAALMWLESIVLYCFSLGTHIQDLGPGNPAALSFFGIPIGYAQTSLVFLNLQTYRPNAFYYEPSYAACALTFAFFLLFFLDAKKTHVKSGWMPALVLSSVFLSSSRTGFLSSLLFFLIVFIALGLRPEGSPIRRSILKAVVISVLMIGVFCAFPNGRKYIGFMAGPLGADSTIRIQNTATSEGGRLENAKQCFQLWTKSPLLGYGVVPRLEAGNKGLAQISLMTWLEIALESGILGILAFLYALVSSMNLAWNRSFDFPLKTLVLAAWIMHFSVHLALTQTFPRLDYWLLFFLSIRLLVKSGEPKTDSSRR